MPRLHPKLLHHRAHRPRQIDARGSSAGGRFDPEGGRKQYLDRLPVERARGITVKAHGVAASRAPGDGEYLLPSRLPGTQISRSKVSRSLAACEGAILLVDATQGVQAQTIATFYLALEQSLSIVPVANKVDMERDRPRVAEQMSTAFRH